MMNPGLMRSFIQRKFKEFRPGFAFVWTIMMGMLIGWVLRGKWYTISEKKFIVAFFALLGLFPWIPLILGKIAGRATEEIFMRSAVHHPDFHRANKLISQRRRWEAVEEFKTLLREKPDDPDLLFRLAEVYWVELGDVSEGLDRFGALWKRVQTPDKNVLWVNAFPVARAMSIAMRISDIHYISRHFSDAVHVLEELLVVRGGELKDYRDVVADRIEGMKKLKTVRPSTLVLFDIDGTLSTSGGAGGKAVAAAFEETYGKPIDLSKIDFRGRTDISLWREMLSTHGLSYATDDLYLDAFKRKYIAHLQKMLLKSDPKSTLGAPILLNRLEREPTVALALLTGNIEAGGRTKLQAVDLNRFFPVGGFGEDGEDRAQIARAAVRRSEEFYRTSFDPSRIFVVGDAEADIQAAKSSNLKSIAVATGWTDKADLSRLEPDLMLDDLRQSAAFLSAIGIEDPTGHRLSAIDPA